MSYFAPNWTQLKAPSFGRVVYITITCLLLLSTLTPTALHIEQATSLKLFFNLRGPTPAPKDTLVIAINSAAAEQMQQSKYSGDWPRTIHAELLNRLHQAKASLTVVDIAFKEPHSENEDAALQQALTDNPRVILFTYLKRQQINTGAGLMDIEQEIPPIPRFHAHTLASGSFTLPKYPAYVYNTQLFNTLSGGRTPSQPVLAYLAQQTEKNLQAVWNASSPTAESWPQEFAKQAMHLADNAQSIATSQLTPKQKQIEKILKRNTPITINFYGPTHTVKTRSIDTVLAMDEHEFSNTFKGKTVYIGFSDNAQTEQQDTYRTIFSSDFGVDLSGVEISATVFSNLTNNTYIRTPQAWLLLTITCIALAVGFTCYRANTRWCAGLQIVILAIYLISAYALFKLYYIWLPIALPCTALFIANSFMLSRRFNQNKKRIQKIQFALSQYLPNDAAKKLSRNVTSLEKQHQLVHGVCLMTDIQGYTTLSETLAPDVLHNLMNTYYAELVDTVEQNGGFIGNLVGDGMLALWTGPEITPQMCQSAFTTAQQIQQRINNNPKLEHPLPTCSAIHGGQFSLGNLGAHGHFEYSPVGDIINTVSRVEHFNRNLGTHFLCTVPIAEQLNKITENKTKLRLLGSFTFRHKSMAMPLYGLVDDLSQIHLDIYEKALKAYEKKDYEKAAALFEEVYSSVQDGSSQYFITEMANNK